MTSVLRGWFRERLRRVQETSWRQRASYTAWGTLHVFNFACAIHLLNEYVFRISMMEGPSMLPTLGVSGELVVEDRISLRLFPNSIHRGDLIILQSPIEPGRLICKRVLGMPGDIVCADPTGEVVPSTEHVVIPKGHVWISGDNAAHSRDSRTYGPVSMGLIEGKLFARLWPPNAIRIFRNPTTRID